MPQSKIQTARRVALVSIAVSGSLAVMKITAGWLAGSRSVLADGFEAAGDVVASTIVLFGLALAARPPDENHPYGHGRVETLSGFLVGLMLAAAGAAIGVSSVWDIGQPAPVPAAFAVWPMLISVSAKVVLSIWKFRHARLSGSAGLEADAWNDSVDILSGTVALGALGLTLYDPSRFPSADRIGGLLVGFIVIYLGLRVVRDTTMQLIDTMPDDGILSEVRRVARSVPGTLGVEKCFARKTGLQYHVELHLEVDPQLTVERSHEIGGEVRRRVRSEIEWVADVLVHIEPAPATVRPAGPGLRQ